jgi:hypothetical protein
MMGSTNISILQDNKHQLCEYMIKFAKYDAPDFVIMKEALNAFILIIKNTQN